MTASRRSSPPQPSSRRSSSACFHKRRPLVSVKLPCIERYSLIKSPESGAKGT
jgi:hypothetical protein